MLYLCTLKLLKYEDGNYERCSIKVKDISLADWGRKEIRLAEADAWFDVNEEYAASQPLKGARIVAVYT